MIMRFVFLLITTAVTVTLCWVLDGKSLFKVRMGRLLSPQEGLWQNAEPVNQDFSENLTFSGLKGKVDVYFDDRLVPHIMAEQEEDAFFAQGYLHAKFRLWQMEIQTMSAAGRASEWVGNVALNHDREFRRLGMVYAAENSLKAMEADPDTKAAMDNYTAGVNAYIQSLTKSSLPIEYKLLDCQPEKWSNLKSALFLKYMSYDLAGHDNDFEMTAARDYLSSADFDLMFPDFQQHVDPVIPKDSLQANALRLPTKPASADSLYFKRDSAGIQVSEVYKPNPENGSNNWAVAGSKTKSGAPILCNDPHLGLNLPSIWYEIQISTPTYNVYGVSFPGAPGVIIGYNDDCAFGFTNGGRDVRDYYEVTFKDASRNEYLFNGTWTKSTKRIETIKVAGQTDQIDTVIYTHWGPVMYDHHFAGQSSGTKKNYAVKWSAHQSSNELKMFYLLNRAKNYNDYLQAVKYLKTPGQNCIFACRDGDIALRTQGDFPAKWKGQGDFVMPGNDSSYDWQFMIPENETPFQYNPPRGFVSSANQRPADTSYPYYLGRDYPMIRGLYINRQLNYMNNISIQDMIALQNSNYNLFAEMAIPVMVNHLDAKDFGTLEKKYMEELRRWDFNENKESRAAVIFDLFWKQLKAAVYDDELSKAPKNIAKPQDVSLLEALMTDSVYKFTDNIYTPALENEELIMLSAFRKTAKEIEKMETEGKLNWGAYKDAHISHLLKISAFSSEHLVLGGGKQDINAITSDHGPSWRMVVQLSDVPEAYGIYPGGQSGNPGSKYYNNAIENWSSGNYFQLWKMQPSDKNDARITGLIHFAKSK